jgi:Bacterial pre-peptidase C-terminal domain
MLQLVTGYRSRSTLIGVTCLVATAVACGPSSAPAIEGLTDQVAQVGTELVISVAGTDPEGDHLVYGFHAVDLPDVAEAAALTESPSGLGVFRWTPLGTDVGRHPFDFTVSDGTHMTTVTINIDVRSSIGATTAPVFRTPGDTGTTIDLATQTCLDLEIAVDDQDTPTLRLSQGEPIIEGAELTVSGGHTATWHWCPSRAQQAEARYTLELAADDGDNPRTTKEYLIVLRGGDGTSCPGTPPAITHTPKDAQSILGLAIAATITDDKGIKDAPLLYVADVQPPTPIDLARMTQVPMTLTSGDAKNGVYTGTATNPVAQLPAGTKQTLYYVFVANDDDDTTGTCDHSTVSQVYSMAVTSTGTADQPICVACTGDAQCGAGDECVRMGAAGATFCLQACGAGCPTGYSCSTTKLTSVDGASAFQCVPDSGSCAMPTQTCADDTWEVNDSRSDASHNPVMTPDTYDLISCPSTTSTTRANDDYYKIVVPSDQRIDLQLAGGPETDLDLHLYHSDGTVVTASTSLEPNEQINTCLTAGTYYIKVNGFGSARNEYLFSYDSHAESCATTCVDDAKEDDDTYSQAREIDFPDYASTGNKICPNDDDWYHVPLFTGEVMTVDLAFTQSTSHQDLDLHLYKASVDLTPCDADHPDTCTTEHGQGGTSNEHTTFTAPAGCDAGCDYYVVVRGFDQSANSYGIAIGVR